MADTTIRFNQPALTGSTLYVKVENAAGQVWNGTALVAYVLANLATYATAVAESPSGSGRWSLDFLALGLPADDYTWTIGKRIGGSPAISDPVVGSGGDHWDGATFGAVAVASLPTPAPTGYGPVGTGSRAVNADYPTAGNLAYKTAGGQGIGGANVRAYLASEYNASPNTATIRGQTLTINTGAWASNIDLDQGSYVITFDAAGYQTTIVNLTVS